MSDVMQSLHNDHVNFNRLLNLLKEALVILQCQGKPDYNLMLDIVDYLENYADYYHHPKEDMVYEFHLERSDQGRDAIAELMRQHKSLKQLTAQFRSTIEGLLRDAVISRSQFIAQLADFIERQADHLNAEEASIFPILKQTLTPRDWAHLDAMLPTRTDPVFSNRAAKQYAALLERIGQSQDQTDDNLTQRAASPATAPMT